MFTFDQLRFANVNIKNNIRSHQNASLEQGVQTKPQTETRKTLICNNTFRHLHPTLNEYIFPLVTVCACLDVRSFMSMSGIFFGAHVCKVTFKYLPQLLGTLGHLLKILPLCPPKSPIVRGEGGELFEAWNPYILFTYGLMPSFRSLGQLLVRAECVRCPWLLA